MAQKSYRKHKKPFIFVVTILAIAALCYGLHATNILFPTHRATSASSYTKGEPTTSSGSESSSNSNNNTSNATTGNNSNVQPGDQKSLSGGPSVSGLQDPTGGFVSDHHPNLSGSPDPNSLTSVCTTTPGATCQISFSQNGTIRSLPDETTDRGGSAYWNWTLQGLGLTTGSWQIRAVATLNGHTATTIDPMDLEISK